MGKISKVVVCGQSASGKTALLEQLIYGNHVVNTVSRLLDIAKAATHLISSKESLADGNNDY